MHSRSALPSILALTIPTFLLLAGHEGLAHQLRLWLAARDGQFPARVASSVAAIAATACGGIVVLPLLSWLRRRFPSPDAPRIAVFTALAVVDARAMVESIGGIVIEGLPIVAMAVLTAAIPVLVAPRWAPAKLRSHRDRLAAVPRNRVDAAA